MPAPVIVNSPEFEELLERTPSRMMRWGVVSVALFFSLLIALATLVQYPDTLEGRAFVTTDPLPIKILAPSGGRIIQVMATENQVVERNQVLGEIENTTGLRNIEWLEARCAAVSAAIEKGDMDTIRVMDSPGLNTLGEAQELVNKLLEDMHAYTLLSEQHIYDRRIKNLTDQSDRYHNISSSIAQSKGLVEDELKRAEQVLEGQQKIYEKNIISKNQYFDALSLFNKKKQELESQPANIEQNRIAVAENRKQIFDIQYEKTERRNSLILAIESDVRSLQSFIQTWKQRYLLTAPFAGTLHELRPLQANEVLAQGEELFIITPRQFRYIVSALIPSTSFGKIENNQPAHILLDQFPYNEFGYLEGNVSFISTTPQSVPSEQDNNQPPLYRVHIKLTDSSHTSYHRKINLTPEMSGTARIITRDKNVLQRLMETVGKINK